MASGLSRLRNFSRVVYVSDSSNIESLGYNPADSLLLVNFKNGTSYLYQRVSGEEFGKVAGASSVGKAYLRFIKPKQAQKV